MELEQFNLISRSLVSTHTLDTTSGCPAEGVVVRLGVLFGDARIPIAIGITDAHGRVGNLGPTSLTAGNSWLAFDTCAYFAGLSAAALIPQADLVSTVTPAEKHCHLPSC